MHDPDDAPNVCIRRWGDGCFHAVEEIVPEGYIVQGVLIAHDEVLEVRPIEEACPPPPPPAAPPPPIAPTSRAISLLDKLADIPVAFVDVETTGASPFYGDRVIEVGIRRVVRGEVVDYQQLLDPRRRIGPGITALTGITPEMCAGQPLFVDVAGRVAELLRGAVVVGHNVGFDLGFLMAEFVKAGRDMSADVGKSPILDTVMIARKRFGRGGNGLQNLARRLLPDGPPTTAHRALADAHTTAALLAELLPAGVTLLDAFMHQGGPRFLEPARRDQTLPLELEEALDAQTDVQMEYLDARDARTQRIVRPLELRRSGGETLLVAWCQLRNERRTFKLDRIVTLTRVADTLTRVDARPADPETPSPPATASPG